MNFANVLTVVKKELLDVSRDRRAVFVMIVLPLLLYPLMTIGFTQASLIQVRTLEKRQATVWVRDLERQPLDLVKKLTDEQHHLVLKPEPSGIDEATEASVLARGEVQAILHPPQRLGDQVATIETTSHVEIVFNGGVDSSMTARTHLVEAITEWRHSLVQRRLEERSLPPSFVDPVEPSFRDVAPKGAILGRILAFILVVSSLMGAFYPAIDLGAGEKERGTLETLLLAPAERVEIAAGKFGAVFVIALANALLNICSLGVTFAHFSSLAAGGELAERLGSVTVTLDIGAAMLVVLVPLVALFSALTLAISTMATSYKEGTSYLQPLGIVAMLLSAVSTLPGIELSTPVCLVPVTGAAILFKELLGGTAHGSHVLVVIIAHAAYAAIAIRWVAQLYGTEEVLVRPAAAAGLDLLRATPRKAGEPLVPSLPQAVVAGVMALLLVWFAGQKLQQPPHTLDGLVLTLVFLVGLPPLIYARGLKLDLIETFRLRAPRWTALLAALLIAVGGQIIAHDIANLQARFMGEPLEQEKQAWLRLLQDVFDRGPIFALALIAALPAVCEEILFRGFILTGLRSGAGAWVAVIVSALLFGVTHLDPSRMGAVTALGAALALLALRSRSIVPCMLCHFAHNGLALVIVSHLKELEAANLFANGQPTWILRGSAIFALAVGLGLVFSEREN
ncbi:MAG TPA: ABC transporter permease subunit/CPBP intramembrane protease [Planctomycetota bacterium]|nr:ABC transporter permease subunit/CPBP intramembrane protease [Planctomycetota bacterium]